MTVLKLVNQFWHRRVSIALWGRTATSIILLSLTLVGLAKADPDLPVINTNLIFDVTNTVFAGGALGNGSSNSAAAIQAAINMASTQNVSGLLGATVRVPAVGSLSNYVCGPINLASHVNLLIDTNAQLQMLPKSSWSGTTTFINGATLTDVSITGSGTIDGQGAPWWAATCGSSRPNFIEFDHSKRILIQGVTLQNPPTFHIMVHNNNGNLTIQNIRINTPSVPTSTNACNTDGIDLASTNVLIRNCYISDGDDNIQIGSSSAFARNITISNCTFGAGHGVSIGSPTQDGVTNLLVNNCVWNGTEFGIKIKTDRGIGGVMQNLTYQNLVMSNINFVIAFYDYYNELGSPSSTISVTPFMASTDLVQTVTSTTPVIKNITISNITASAINGNIAGIIWGLPESLVSNVTISKVNITAPTKTFCVYNATGIQIIDSNLTAPNTTTNTFTIYNAGMTVSNSTANSNLVTLGGLAKPPTNNVLSFFNGRALITDTNMDGAGTFTLGGTTLAFRQPTVTFSNNVNAVSASTLLVSNGTETVGGALLGAGPLSVILTNTGALRFNQGVNVWGGSSANFSAGSSGTINNSAPAGNTSIYLGALSGGSGAVLRGSDQNGPGVDTYVVGNLNSNTTFAGTIGDGTGSSSPHAVALVRTGSGTFALSGANTYSGGTTVSNGTLLVENTAGSATGTGAVTVVTTGALGGSGVIAGPVTVNGTLAPGNSPGTLTVSNSLVMSSGAVLQYQLGTNGDLTKVSGDLTIDGTLNITDAGGFTNATYTLFTYGGALTDNGVTVGTTPTPSFSYTISTNTPGQVNLVVAPSCSVDSAGSITGSGSVNAGDSAITYSISSVSGATTYTWSVPPGAAIASGQGTTSITVNYSCSAISGNVVVTPADNTCSGGSSTLPVTVTNVGGAGAITGAAAVCSGQTGLTYSISPVGGATTYAWTVPAGATVTSGQGTTSITVDWGTIAGNVQVTPLNGNSCAGATASLSVSINAAPGISSGPSPQTVCVGGTANFTVSATGAGLNYQWQENGSNISDGGTISGSGMSTLTLTGVGPGDSGASFVCVVTGSCSPPATSGAATLTVIANPATFNVTGGGAYCAGGSGVTIGLDGSEPGVSYQLQVNGGPTDVPQLGTGGALTFANETTAGAYTVIASNTTSGCAITMNGSATISFTDPYTCWQLQYFGSTNCALCSGDVSYTGDFMSNTNKFLAGFNPTNSAAHLQVNSVAKSGANITVTYLGASGDTNYLPGFQSRTNVLDFTMGGPNGTYTNAGWQDTFQTNILSDGTGLGAITNMTDVGGATNVPSRYYRVRVLLP
ncbi:MAG TPA: glycosyl hydrolase family 28 protein [Verrucomicrobiae bacterium]|nr:glycosyl hydrolase family 28 protein [Verrucomicrobiae bacterium]